MAASDTFVGHARDIGSPVRNAFVITPHATNELPYVTRAVYVGGAGDIVAVLADDTDPVTFKAVPVGMVLPIRAKRILNTSSATYMLGLY